jgi:hypothetical protein
VRELPLRTAESIPVALAMVAGVVMVYAVWNCSATYLPRLLPPVRTRDRLPR